VWEISFEHKQLALRALGIHVKVFRHGHDPRGV
jgi:hypothetical protein